MSVVLEGADLTRRICASDVLKPTYKLFLLCIGAACSNVAYSRPWRLHITAAHVSTLLTLCIRVQVV